MKKILLVIVVLLLIGGGAYYFTRPQPVDPTAWKTYINKDFGFSVQYPPTYIVNAQQSIDTGDFFQMDISDPATKASYVSIGVWKDQKSIDDVNNFFTGPFPKEIAPFGNTSSTTVVERTLNGYKGVQRSGFAGEGTSYDVIFMYKNKYLYQVYLDAVMEGKLTEEREPGTPVPDKTIYDRILASVRINP